MERSPGSNVVSMAEWLERRAAPAPEDIPKRLAEIALQQLLLASEKRRLEHQLGIARLNPPE